MAAAGAPIWYGVLALVLDAFPVCLTIGAVVELQKQQFGSDAYWIVNGSMILQSLLSAPGLALAGYLSQPDRLGRRRVMLGLSALSACSTAVLAATEDQYVVVSVRTLLSCTAAGHYGLYVVALSWCTDWCGPGDKLAYVGILQGSQFGAFSAGVYASALMDLGNHALFKLAFVLQLINVAFISLCFPQDVARSGELRLSSLARKLSAPQVAVSGHEPRATHPEPRGACGVPHGVSIGIATPWRHISASLKYIFATHGSVTAIYLMINFSNTAVQDNVALFMMKERGFGRSDVNELLGMIGLASFAMQCFGVPAVNSWGLSPQVLLVPSTLAMVVHFVCYAFLTDKLLLIVTQPIGSFGYIAVISTTTIISGVSLRDAPPHDQGTLMGTLSGLRMLASCVGPLVLAGITTYWRQFPAPLDWAGVGYAVLACVMTAALALSLRLCSAGRP